MAINKHLASPSSYRIQKTISEAIEFEGIGLHSGQHCKIRLNPAGENHGVWFQKQLANKSFRIPAHYDFVVSTSLATSVGIKNEAKSKILTIEHLMSALFAIGVNNLLVEVWGPEIPILDGSATDFVEGILKAGLEIQGYTTPVMKVKKPIKTFEAGAICELLPRDRLRLTASIDFPHPSIGIQTFALELNPETFRKTLAEARTFGFADDLEKLKKMSLAQGASMENVLAYSKDKVLNPEGPRFTDECVRHKVLDAIGDLALCGTWIEAEMVSYRGGHSIHSKLLKALKSHQSNWELIPAERISLTTPLPFRKPAAARP